MKKWLPAVCLGTLLFGLPAMGGICSFDNEPAATLLLPYFEVDLDDPSGLTTLMTIGNAEAAPRIVHLVVWSDLGIPVLDFDLYLTGYDVHSINLRDLFSGEVAQNTGPSVTPAGNFSDPNIAFPSCGNTFPGPPNLPPPFVDHMRELLTGGPSPILGGQCAGRDLGDNIARGYITVDLVRECSFLFPTDDGYFGPEGVLAYDNVLFGDYSYIDVNADFAQGESLVRIQADPTAFDAGSDMTFYSTLGSGGTDAREPLSYEWASRFLSDGELNLQTDLIVWRDAPDRDREPFDCGTLPAWLPMYYRASEFIAFDEEENGETPDNCPVCSPPSTWRFFPAAAQRLRAGGGVGGVPTSWSSGWFSLDLRNDEPTTFFRGEASVSGPVPGQAVITTHVRANGAFSVGFNATPTGESCRGATVVD